MVEDARPLPNNLWVFPFDAGEAWKEKVTF
jgi:hypothetical protein